MVQVLRLLLAHCESEEECRNVVAECLGHLALLHPSQVLPSLQEQAGAASPSARAAVVTAVKSMLLPQPHPIDPLLRTAIPGFLALVSDPDRCARGVCLAAWHGHQRLARLASPPATLSGRVLPNVRACVAPLSQ